MGFSAYIKLIVWSFHLFDQKTAYDVCLFYIHKITVFCDLSHLCYLIYFTSVTAWSMWIWPCLVSYFQDLFISIIVTSFDTIVFTCFFGENRSCLNFDLLCVMWTLVLEKAPTGCRLRAEKNSASVQGGFVKCWDNRVGCAQVHTMQIAFFNLSCCTRVLWVI